MIYGEKFKIISKKNDWLKIKTITDGYIGYIKNNKLISNLKISHKCNLLKTSIYINQKKSKNYLPFNSRISINTVKKGYGEFEKGKWIKLKEVKKKDYLEKDFLKIVSLFLGSKYFWGGKTFMGIDCSALIQLIYLFNNKFFPRDTKDQILFTRGRLKKKSFKKGDIIYWKGHVAICIDKKRLIHAYGPRKKVLIMNINNTIKLIEKTADLKIKKIVRV